MDTESTQILRALRGGRSQIQLARKLGYRSNPIAEWEGGRRSPSGVEFFRVCSVTGLDVAACLAAFHEPSAAMWAPDSAGLARWLSALRGDQPIGELARRSGVTRHALSKWLRGETKPRLPDLLRVIEGATGRLPDLVAVLVDIDAVPTLRARWEQLQRSRTLLVERPWSLAVLALIEVDEPEPHAHSPAHLGKRLGIDPAEAQACIDGLLQAGTIHRVGSRLALTGGALTVATPEGYEALKRHWTRVALERIGQHPGHRYSHNVFGVTEADLGRIQELQSAFYRQVRAIVAESEPTEVVALMNVQVVRLVD